MSIAIDRAEFIATDLEKYTSYEDETKSCVELKDNSNFDADFKANVLPSYKFKNRNFYFSDKLQNYSKAGQSLRYSIAFY